MKAYWLVIHKLVVFVRGNFLTGDGWSIILKSSITKSESCPATCVQRVFTTERLSSNTSKVTARRNFNAKSVVSRPFREPFSKDIDSSMSSVRFARNWCRRWEITWRCTNQKECAWFVEETSLQLASGNTWRLMMKKLSNAKSVRKDSRTQKLWECKQIYQKYFRISTELLFLVTSWRNTSKARFSSVIADLSSNPTKTW